MSQNTGRYDLVVVGAGIIGLATAYAACSQGMRVAVVERSDHCVGASIRNFGFVTVTGQRRGEHWARARRSRDIWAHIAPRAGIQVVHQGLYVVAQREAAVPLLQAFLTTEMGEGCQWLEAEHVRHHHSSLNPGRGVLYSPHELRVESRDAIPQLAQWLASEYGVDFYWNTAVQAIDLPQVFTSRGVISASHCAVCPGADLNSLYPEVLVQARARLCTLQMLRIQANIPLRLPGAVMSDLSLVRYEGYADLPEAQPLKEQLGQEQADYLQRGIHLIAVQSADGSLVVGDSHVYGTTEAPFACDATDTLIMQELHKVLNVSGAQVTQHWTGTYPSADDVVFKMSPAKGVAIGVVTGGTGASTGFAFGQEILELAIRSA